MAQRTRLLAHLQLLSGAGGTLGRLPGIAQLLELAAVTDLVEVWDGDLVHLEGSARFDADASVEHGGFGLGLGPPGARGLVVPFAVTLPAEPVRLLLAGMSVAAGLVEAGEVVDDFEDYDIDEQIDAAAAALGEVAVRVGPVSARLEFPEEWLQAGELVTENGQVVRVDPIDGAPPVSVPLGQIAFEVRSSAPWFDLVIDGPASAEVPLELPPAIIAETGVALELRDVVWHRGGDLPQQAADLGLPDDWRGLLIGEAHVWGLERLLPGMPTGDALEDAEEGDPDDAGESGTVTALGFRDWVIDADGVRGHVEIGFPPSDGTVRPRRFGLEFDRSWWPVGMRAEAGFDLGGLLGDDERVIDVTADLRLDPHAEPGQRWELELALRSEDDDALASLEGDALTAFGAACGTLALLAGGSGGGARDAGLLLGALAALGAPGSAGNLADWEHLAIEGASASIRPEAVPVEGDGEARARVLRVALDVRLAASLMPTGDDPIPIELGASRVVADLVLDDVDGLDRPRLAVDWSIADGLRVTLPAPVDVAGPVTITSASLRKTSDPHALVLELGVDPAGASDVAIGGLPDLLVTTYTPPDGIDVSLARSGQSLTLLVPGALYATGTLRRDEDGEDPLGGGVEWGEVLRGELRAFLVADGEPSGLDLLKKENYLFDLELGLLSATSVDGSLQAFVVTLDAGFRPGLPIGGSGASLYGLGLTFAQNGAPGAIDGDYASWFFGDRPEFEPPYSTIGTKWVPQAGHWGFGASVTVGSSPDSGRSWNVGAGLFVLLPGPVIMVTGEGDLFAELPQLPAELPQLPAEGGNADEIDAVFAAVIVLDLLRDRFSLDLRGELERSAGGKSLLHVDIPAAIRVDLRNPIDFLVAIGMPPEEDRVSVTALDLIDLSGYLVLAGKGIDLPLRGADDLPLPGVALALGGAGGLDKRFSVGPVSIELWARAGFDVGLSLSIPLLAGQVWVDGGIDASAFGFGVSMRAELTLGAIAPSPFFVWGEVRVVIDLPWFLPDIDVSASLEIGDEAGWLTHAPLADSPVESLSLWDRGTGAPTVVRAGADGQAEGVPLDAEGVPLDAIPEIVFRVPVGNDTDEFASVSMVGADAEDPVWELATTGEDDDGRKEHLGYRHVLTDCVLRKVVGSSVETVDDVCASWPEGTENGNTPTALDAMGAGHIASAAGGQVARTKLRLLDPLASPVEARVGIGAELTEQRWSGWDPCEIPPDDREAILRAYTFQSLATLLGEGLWQPPVIDVDIRPVDPDDEDDDEGRPIIRPRPIPDLVIDKLPDLPDIRPLPIDPDLPDKPEPPEPRPRPGPTPTPIPRPGTGPRPQLTPRPGTEPDPGPQPRPGAVPTPGPAPQPGAAATPPLRPGVIAPRPGLRPLHGGRQALRAALARADDAAAAAQARDGDEDDGEFSLQPLAPLVANSLGLGEAVLLRPPPVSAALLADPITLTGSLPLLWASAAGAVELEAEQPHALPNVTPPDDLAARLVIEPMPDGAGLWQRMLGATSEPARLGLNPAGPAADALDLLHGIPLAHDDPVLGLPRLVLPAGKGFDPTSPQLALMAAGALGRARVDLPYSERAEAVLLLAPGVEPLVWAVHPDGEEELVQPAPSTRFAIDGEGSPVWRLVSVRTIDPVVALRLAAVHGQLSPPPDEGRLPVAAALLAVGAHAPWRDRSGPARRSLDAYADVIGELLDQRDAWGDGEAAGVLDPDSTYEVVVTGRSYPAAEQPDVDPGRLQLGESRAEDWKHTFQFHTAKEPPAELRAHPADAVTHGDPSPDAAADDAAAPLADQDGIDALWQVATSPADGAPSHYLDDDLLVRLRDARTLAVFAAFDRHFQVRLIDETGGDIERALEARLRAASDIAGHDEVVRDRLGELGCLLPDGADPADLYQEAVLELEAELEPGLRYVAELHAVEEGEPPDSAPVHRWRFRASRWHDLAEHLDAHVPAADDGTTAPLDEVVPDGPAVVAALAAKLDGAGEDLVTDDEALDAWLVDTLRVPPRPAPGDPELTVVWAWDDSTDATTPVALLLDGPEPLLRDPGPAVTCNGGDVAVKVVTGRSRARVLVVPTDGVLPTGTLEVAVSSRGATAARVVSIGEQPAVFAEEGA